MSTYPALQYPPVFICKRQCLCWMIHNVKYYRLFLDLSRLTGNSTLAAAAGIEVRLAESAAPFRDRFAVIDGQIVITGSYDWSDDASTRSYDAVVLISCSDTAQQFKSEFDRLWQKFGMETGATTSAPSSAPGVQAVIIYSVNPAEECIQLLDVSSAPIDIGGWRLSDLEGSYAFPPDTIISPDDPYEVCIDTYNPTYDPQGLFLNDDHDEVFLIAPDGRIIDERVWGN